MGIKLFLLETIFKLKIANINDFTEFSERISYKLTDLSYLEKYFAEYGNTYWETRRKISVKRKSFSSCFFRKFWTKYLIFEIFAYCLQNDISILSKFNCYTVRKRYHCWSKYIYIYQLLRLQSKKICCQRIFYMLINGIN